MLNFVEKGQASAFEAFGFSKTGARAGVEALRRLYQMEGAAVRGGAPQLLQNLESRLARTAAGTPKAQRLQQMLQSTRKGVGQGAEGLRSQIGGLESQAGNILTGRSLPTGSQIRNLGGGSEGVAQHVLTPQGSRVAKVYDVTSEGHNPLLMQARESMVGKNIPQVARIESSVPMKSQMGTPTRAHMMEYVHGQQPKALLPEIQQAAQRGMPGYGFADVRTPNVIQTPSGQQKIVDAMPVSRSHFKQDIPAASRGHMARELEFNSPTIQSFRGIADPSSAGALRNAASPLATNPMYQALLKAKDPRAMTLQGQMEKHYQGQVLRGAYTGAAPRAFTAPHEFLPATPSQVSAPILPTTATPIYRPRPRLQA